MITSRGMRFVAAQGGWLGSAPRPAAWALDGVSYRVVEPTRRYVGTVVSVHGMTPMGPEDPRMTQLHGALASLGFRVVAPWLPSVAGLRMHAGQIDQIEACLRRVSNHPGLAPSGRVSVFAPSFSGGLALIAAARAGVADRVRAILALGAYGNVRTTMRTLLHEEGYHAYAWKLVFSNFLEVVHRGTPQVAEALRTAALDEWSFAGAPELPAAKEGLSPASRALLDRLLADGDFRRRTWDEVVRRSPPFLTQGSVVDQIEGLRAYVVLVHGARDPTIPSRQSEEIYRAMQELGHAGEVLVTPSLGHGGLASARAGVWGAPSLLSTFERFFDRAAERPWPRLGLRSRRGYRRIMSTS